MATTLSPNLKLRISDGLTVDAKYNLERIDTLAGIFSLDLGENTLIRSIGNISLLPHDPSRGGDGVPGQVTLGTPDQSLSLLQVYAQSVQFSTSIGLLDQAVGGNKQLNISYNTSLDGAVDTAANRQLSIDLNGANRALVLGGDFTLQGNLKLISSFNQTLSLPANYGTNGQLLQTDGSGNLSWASASGSGTVTSVALSAPAEFSVSGSPITSSGTLAISKAAQAANSVWAGPISGPAAEPSFRALTLQDFPLASLNAAFTWSNADGATKTINHSFNSQQLLIQVLDANDNYATIQVSEVTRPTVGQVVLQASSAPVTNWIVLISKIGV